MINRSHKEHIQFLRAIAVLLVFLYHLKIPYFDKGYLGVDIFFVISGYVITKQLLTKYFSNNKINIIQFYIGRLKRLFPALIVVCFLTYCFYQFFGPSSLTPTKQTIFSIFGVSNIYFLLRNKDYFDNIFDDPLGHTWSLGLEEQTYLIYPLILLAMFFFYKKKFIFHIIFILGLASLISYYFLSKSHPNHVFYLPIFRFWEFAFGACIYLYFKNFTYKNNLIFLIAFIIIILFLMFSKVEYIYNNFIIVLFTTILIIFSTSQKIFINKFFIYIGNTSYSIYLLHLPIIYFLDIYFYNNKKIFLSFLLTMLLSHFLYELIEKKFRYLNFNNIIYKFCSIALIIVTSFFIYLKFIDIDLKQNLRNIITSNNYLEKNFNWKNRTLARYKVIDNLFYDYCRNNPPKKFTLNEIGIKKECFKSDQSDRETVFYVEGNSLTAQFSHVIDQINTIKNAYYKLNHFNKISFEEVNKLSNLYNNLIYVTEINTDEYFGLSKIEAIKNATKKFNSNVKILLIFSNPRDIFNFPLKCMVQNRSCNIDKSQDFESRKLENLLKEINNLMKVNDDIFFYNTYENLCPTNNCFSYNSDKDFLMLRDANHLSVEAADSIVESVRKFINNKILN